jgi:hypothetical protein
MNSSNTSTGGFTASELRTYLVGYFITKLVTAIGGIDYIYPLRLIRSKKTNYEWNTYTIWVPSEIEVFGTRYYGDEGVYGYNSGVGYITNVQFPIFQSSYEYRIKYFNGSRAWWWESTPTAHHTTNFCTVYDYGATDYSLAGNASGGVSPCFAIS